MTARALFERHLDLTLLKGRARGLVRCPFHGPDHHPSLSVDLDRGLFNCFSCGVAGGLRAFAERVGEAQPGGGQARRPETEWHRAWRRIEAVNLAQARRLAEWIPLWALADWMRRSLRAAAEARRLATQLGPDDARTWSLLERAARVEARGLALEADLEALAALERIA